MRGRLERLWPEAARPGRARLVAVALLAGCYTVLWIGGVGHYLLVGPVGPGERWTAPLFLAVAGLLVLISSSTRRDGAALVAVAALGFGVELLGVRTGVPFGDYSYTDALEPALFGVPVVMGPAWLVLVAYVEQTLSLGSRPAVLEVPAAAAWMTAVDLVLDPVAADHLGYWRWADGGAYYGIPASNFAGWFVVSLVIFALVRRATAPNVVAWLVGLTIVLFFALVALSFGLFAAAAVGFGLCALSVAARSRAGDRSRSAVAPSAPTRR